MVIIGVMEIGEYHKSCIRVEEVDLPYISLGRALQRKFPGQEKYINLARADNEDGSRDTSHPTRKLREDVRLSFSCDISKKGMPVGCLFRMNAVLLEGCSLLRLHAFRIKATLKYSFSEYPSKHLLYGRSVMCHYARGFPSLCQIPILISQRPYFWNSQSLLSSGQTWRVFSQREMQWKWKACYESCV